MIQGGTSIALYILLTSPDGEGEEGHSTPPPLPSISSTANSIKKKKKLENINQVICPKIRLVTKKMPNKHLLSE